MAADRDGLESRERLAAMIGKRLALGDARAAGWVPFVVTNGTVEQQERKLRHTGLDRDVAGWVISEGIWLHQGRPWSLATCQPAHVADSFPHAVEILLDLGGCGR